MSLEKLGEGAFSSVFKGISRSEVTYESQHTHTRANEQVTGCLTCVSSSVEDKRAAGGSEGDPHEDRGGCSVYSHQRRWNHVKCL